MLHREWINNEKLITELLEKSNLTESNGEISQKSILMREIIISKYLKYMTVEETCANIMFEYGIELSRSKYNRLFKVAIRMMEKHI